MIPTIRRKIENCAPNTSTCARKVVWIGLLALLCLCSTAQAQPSISGFLVNGVASITGPVGATLTIQGSGFGSTQGFSTATLNGVFVAGNGVKPTSWSNSSIVVVIPNTASTGPVVVKVSGRSSNSVTFSIGAVITGISPGTALAGSSVTISGQGFGTGGTVTFNGTAATTTSWNSGSIVAQVPNAATAGPVVVTVNGVVSNGMMFTPTPAISSLSPSYALSGATVTIAGNSFGNQTSTVSFNGVNAVVSAWSNTSITVVAPSGALTGNVVVTVNGVASAGQLFTYTPQVSGVSPNPALADTTVQVQGNNFGSQQGSSTITFNGVAAAVTTWTNTNIAATVPGNATAGPVVVTVNGVGSNGVLFSYPALYSFSLRYAPNGDVLTANDSVNGNWSYSYDDFNRLATASNSSQPQGYSYRYDQYGNRWGQDLTAGSGRVLDMTFAVTSESNNGNCYHAGGLNNQPDGYCYDAAGNMLSDGTHSYTYDAENRILQVDGGQTAAYSYDAEGNRVQKANAAGVTAAYIYDLAGHVITEVSGSGAWTRGEVYAGMKHLATYGNGRGGTIYLAQIDWLGTERTRVLPSGDVFETCSSLPFGDGMICSGAADPSPNHMTGKHRDTETGLDYFGARYYASTLGRFITTDRPLQDQHPQDPQSWSLYAYTTNNPLHYVDDTGTIKMDASGNPIFTQTGTGTFPFVSVPAPVPFAPGLTMKVSWPAQFGYVQADDGTHIAASKATGPAQATVQDSSGNAVGTANWALPAGNSDTADCHGTTFAAGQVWIDNSQVPAIIQGDHYTPTSTPAPGDVGIYTAAGASPGNLAATVHSVKVDSVNPQSGAVQMVTSKGGITPLTHTSPETAWTAPAYLTYWHKQPDPPPDPPPPFYGSWDDDEP